MNELIIYWSVGSEGFGSLSNLMRSFTGVLYSMVQYGKKSIQLPVYYIAEPVSRKRIWHLVQEMVFHHPLNVKNELAFYNKTNSESIHLNFVRVRDWYNFEDTHTVVGMVVNRHKLNVKNTHTKEKQQKTRWRHPTSVCQIPYEW